MNPIPGLLLLSCLLPGQSVPTGFSVETLSSGHAGPVGLALLPDGRFILIEQNTGNVKALAGTLVGPMGTIPSVNGEDERGLLGVDVDPGWPGRPYLYFYYSHTSPRNQRLVRYTITGDLGNPSSVNLQLGAQYLILIDIPDQASNHNGGTCRFGPDGMLYVSVGDDANSCSAQQLGLGGVVLRLDISRLPAQGSGPPPKADITPTGNPFSGPTEDARLVWCHGLRNPFRLHPDRVTGRLYVGDVGDGVEEELDEIVQGGGNYGWPWWEGRTRWPGCGGSLPATIFPVVNYDRTSMPAASIIAFPRYRNRLGGAYNFGNAYEGNVFYADYFVGFLRRVVEGPAGWNAAPMVPGQPNPTDWATGMGFAPDSLIGLDGALYFVSQGAGHFRRIKFNPQFPTIVAATTTRGGQPYPVRSRRGAGDAILLALSLTAIPPTPFGGVYGRLEIVPQPAALGVADGSGNFDVTFPVPVQAVGLTVHFQCAALIAADVLLSARHSVLIVP